MITNVSSTVPYAFLVLLVGIGDEGSGKFFFLATHTKKKPDSDIGAS